MTSDDAPDAATPIYRAVDMRLQVVSRYVRGHPGRCLIPARRRTKAGNFR